MSTALKETFARFGVEFDARALVTGNAAVDSAIGNLRELGGVLAGGAIVVGLLSFTEDMRRMGDETGHAATALGLSAESLQEWQGVAGSAGVAANALTPAIQALRRNASAAARTGGQMGMDFRRLGVSLRDANGNLRTTDELLTDTFNGLAAMPDETERAAVAMRLLGESGARLGPAFASGADGIAATREEIRALGGGLSQEAIDAAQELTWQQQRLDTATLSLRSKLSLFLLPALSTLAEMATAVSAGFNRLAGRTRILEAGLATLGTLAVVSAARTLTAWAAAAAPFVALTAAVVALILIVEDLWSAFQGGDSVIADAIDAIEEYAVSGEGFLGGLAMAFELIVDALTSIVQLTAQAAAGLTGLGGFALEALGFDEAAQATFGAAASLGDFGDRDLGTESDGTAEGDRVAARVRARRERTAGTDALTPDAFERFSALRAIRAEDARAAGAGGGGGINIGRIEIDASGLDEAAATRVATTAVERAMANANEDTVDTLGGGA